MDIFHRFAAGVSKVSGSPKTSLIALALIIVWACTGPLFQFSDTWQLIINTSTTICTFLMVFVIQTSQNREGLIVQLKLDELIRSSTKARNRFADLEVATEEELKKLVEEFQRLRKESKN